MKVLGIDYGRQRIGLALGDDETKLASPLETISGHEGFERVAQLIKEQHIGKIVVGLPRGLDGQTTAQTNETREFIDRLSQFGLPVVAQDEAVTSELAAKRVGRTDDKGAIDREAAAIILQDFFDEN